MSVSDMLDKPVAIRMYEVFAYSQQVCLMHMVRLYDCHSSSSVAMPDAFVHHAVYLRTVLRFLVKTETYSFG